ncbi:MAG: tetratricopeptide repeat protein [Anaerolineae bacterium]|nr:tetratricopeptide repeat protein [Anaerolineae bacterium]
MSTPILATKLYIPQPRPNLVRRPRLVERLNACLHHLSCVTVISAPAGFGKTTLVSEWIHQNTENQENTLHHSSLIIHPSQVAWLSLDAGDNDATRFLSYLIAALQTLEPTIGQTVLAALQSPQPLSIESLLTTLLNDIATIPNNFVLVLDDYHVIETKVIDQALTFLLEHPPPCMHLVIATREDPNLPLARLRVRGQLTELRAADLRFTPAEAAGFLNQAMGLNLSAKDVAALESRTEGWIAGLQLAAISMQSHQDTAGFIKSFTGSHRFVMDYLIEEVLHRQSESVQTFLLCTSILERLCGPLCEAVVGRLEAGDWRLGGEGQAAEHLQGQDVLTYLEQANLFVIPLDNERRWYRYHHLFADLLRQQLRQKPPLLSSLALGSGEADQSPEGNIPAKLHLRASRWYEQNGLLSEAIHHALAAEDFERTATLLELIWPTMSGSFQSAIWLRWAEPLPDSVVRVRPVLSMAYGWALLDLGQLEAGELRLQDVERWLGNSPEPPPIDMMVVVDEAQFRTLPGSLATARSYMAHAYGDVRGSVRYARQALDLSPEDDLIRRGQAASLLALAHWAGGELEDAYRVLDEAMASFRAVGQLVFAISGTYGLADIKLTQGRFREAVNLYQQTIHLVEEQNDVAIPGTADLYLGLGDLYRERGDLAEAEAYLAKSEALGEPAALPDWPCRFRLGQSRLRMAQGDLSEALTLLEAAERRYFRSPVPEVRPLAAQKVRLWLALDRLPEATVWVQKRGLTTDDDLSYLREFEHLALARVRIAEHRRSQVKQTIVEALHLLERLLRAAEMGDRWGSVIEILTQQALAHQAHGDLPAALAALERALMLAEPEEYVRLFVDEGDLLAELLTKMKNKQGKLKAYIQKLLTAFGLPQDVQPAAPPGPDKPLAPQPQPLIEPLSERELEVLYLIAHGLSNREISERLVLALSTVKGHNRVIFGKLQVQRRTEAVARARELGLL